jgi:primary-amine oxidase
VQRVRAACLFERLGGEPAWRHVRDENRIVESRARRDLVLRMIIGAGNYDYIVDWIFMQEGMIRVNVGATGIDQVKGARTRGAERTASGEREDRYGRFIAPFLVGVNHSHFLSFRLDMDVDGTANSFVVDKLATERLPANNPRKSIWVVNSTVAAVEKDAMRHSTMESPEFWRVVNPSVSGPFGDPVGFEIGGSHAQATLMAPDDYLRQRAGFTDHTIWATPFNPKELFAAGDYPMFNQAGSGLPAWTKANRSIANGDVVVWYTVGFHHVPRPEDWPVMPVSWHGFDIRPVGFFERNPALDLRKEP